MSAKKQVCGYRVTYIIIFYGSVLNIYWSINLFVLLIYEWFYIRKYHFHSMVNITNFTIIPTERDISILFVLRIWSVERNGFILV